MSNVNVFVDESGIIAKHKTNKTNYFIITLVFVRDEDTEFVKKIFKKFRLQIAKRKSELFQELISNKEIKGSSISEADKHIIYEKLFKKCEDKFELGIIVLKNRRASARFRSNSSRAFNYLIKLFLQNEFVKSEMYKGLDKLNFHIDERNVVTESKFTLQEYLNTELNLTEHFCNEEISVHYFDSKKFLLLQMADFISNSCYRKLQKNNDDNGNMKLILQNTITGKPFSFPVENKKNKGAYNNNATV